MAQRKRSNNHLQCTTQKTRDREKGTPHTSGVNASAPEDLAVPVPLVTPDLLGSDIS